MTDPEPQTAPTRTGLQDTDSLRRLLALPGLGPSGAETIAAAFDSWEEFLASDPRNLPGRSHRKTLEILRIAADTPVPELPAGVRALSRFDADWPRWLCFDGAPVVVFVRGTLPPGGSVAVVGTRQPTGFGVRAVRACIEAVRGAIPATLTGVVSGLARGIDTIAHEAALDAGLPTWAILGSGVDTPTPAGNVGLAERIVAAGGGLLSEQQPGTAPTGGTLILRNRLQVAAASRVFVAECRIPSGTLHTARYAVHLGRRLVVAAPVRADDVASPSTAGNRILLDPAGCDPDLLSASGQIADAVRARRPVADAAFQPDQGH